MFQEEAVLQAVLDRLLILKKLSMKLVRYTRETQPSLSITARV